MGAFKRFSQRYQIKHVNHQIFILVIVTITVPLLILSVIIYLFSLQTVKKEYQHSSDLILTNLSFNIDQYLQSIEKGTLNSQMDSQLQEALEKWSNNKEENIEDKRILYGSTIERFVSSIEMTIKNVDSVRIYASDSVFYSMNFNRADYHADNFAEEDWYIRTLEGKGKIVLFGTHKPFHRIDAQQAVISIARVINKVGSKQPLGVILIDIRLDSLREILNLSENSNRKFIIVDDKGGVIYSSERDQVNAPLLENVDLSSMQSVLDQDTGSFYAPIAGTDSFVNFVTSPYSGWKVIQYIGEKEITKNSELLRMIILGLAFFTLGAALLFMFILYMRVTKPIILLGRQVKLVGMGKFDVNLHSERQDEFGVLYQGIRKMVEDLQDHIERSSITKAQQKVAQFGALKSQINPHFLANALESIQMKAVLSGQRDIGEMVGLLGRLFRTHIQTGKETVTLLEELAHTRLYIQVQQMRFGDKIRYVERLAESSELVPVMHFSLQPIVENAIVHGLEPRTGSGMLEIAATLAGNEMLIAVSDNGVGMDEAKLQQLRERLLSPSDTLDETHIGLKNVHDRIRFYFGDRYGIELDSRLGQGTTVYIRVPAAKDGQIAKLADPLP
ncbi:cache domain-containing sensor histidine kinase [Cohnella cholangitidis]|uniref:histidine kinase n=1 Tax=Cohnella cholangitidis TaxID=2598458 RepID=A0A7G5C1U4_9BACL|nr:sensor histidine kinase [Cohnella cholangitidis]QMV43178.1 sensor histidine kinase [Cohnella cholangitidis]